MFKGLYCMNQILNHCRTALLGFSLFAATPVIAHQGHDHGAPPPPISTTIAPRADASSADFELVAISRGEEVQIYLDTFKGNAPVVGATVDVDVAGTLLNAKQAGDGVYTLTAPALAKPGKHDLAITIQTAETVDILATTLTIAEAKLIVPQEPSSFALIAVANAKSMGADLRARVEQRELSLAVVAAVAFLAGLMLAGLWGRLRKRKSEAVAMLLLSMLFVPLLTAQHADAAEAKTAAKSAERDLAQRFPDGAIFVPKPTQRVLAIRTLFTEDSSYPRTIELPGRVIPDPNGMGIVQPSLSGRLLPPKGGFPRLGKRVAKGDLLATVVPVQSVTDVTSQDQQKREIEQEIALIDKRLKRWRAAPNTVPRKEIEEAELERVGLTSRLEGLASSPVKPEQLVAPIDGVISAARAIAGQVAEPNAVVFEIVDPSRYWVEALSYEAHAFGETANGSFSNEATVALAYRGTGLAERAQAVTLHFEITGSVIGLRAGQFLTVLATTSESSRGIAVPRTSIIRSSNGQSIVYEHTNAERFVPREVRVTPLDGERVLIVSGIEPGKRIVTQGAELLNQIR